MKKKNSKKMNNAGMSLVEIVVVVLIIGILASGAVIGFSFINSRDASNAAEGIMSSLERTKLDTLASKDAVQLELCKEGNHYYGILTRGTGEDIEEVDKIEIAGNGVSIKVINTDSTSTTIGGSNSAIFKYNKANGAFDCSAETIEIVGSDTVTVHLVNATGRCYTD